MILQPKLSRNLQEKPVTTSIILVMQQTDRFCSQGAITYHEGNKEIIFTSQLQRPRGMHRTKYALSPD